MYEYICIPVGLFVLHVYMCLCTYLSVCQLEIIRVFLYISIVVPAYSSIEAY